MQVSVEFAVCMPNHDLCILIPIQRTCKVMMIPRAAQPQNSTSRTTEQCSLALDGRYLVCFAYRQHFVSGETGFS